MSNLLPYDLSGPARGCPVCRGAKQLWRSPGDPWDAETVECHACGGTGGNISWTAELIRRRNVWRWRRWLVCKTVATALPLLVGFVLSSLFWGMLFYTVFTAQP